MVRARDLSVEARGTIGGREGEGEGGRKKCIQKEERRGEYSESGTVGDIQEEKGVVYHHG